MKLQSGHEVTELSDEKNNEQKSLFKAFDQGMVRIQPGGWFYTRPFVDFADKYYNFKFRPTDTIVMTFPKCGTTWMQEILWNMRHPSNLDNPIQGISSNTKCVFLEGDFISSTPEMPALKPEDDLAIYFNKYCQGKDPKDGIFLQLADNLPSPRILKTHLPFSLLTPNMLDTCKVVFLVRNPFDVCVSFYHHSRLLTVSGYVGGLDKYFDLFLDDEVLYGPYWKFMEEGWARKDHPNFHLVHYEDLKAEPNKEISLLNDFLDTGLPENIIKRVVEETSFKNMKERDPFCGNPEGNSPLVHKSKGSFFRSGTVGSWKKELSEDQNKRMSDWIKKNTENGKTFNIKYS